MNFEEKSRLLLQLDEMIRRRYRGDARAYAGKLGVSRGAFFRVLSTLRDEFQAPVGYDRDAQSYVYKTPGRLHIGFQPSGMPPGSADPEKQDEQHQDNRQAGPAPWN